MRSPVRVVVVGAGKMGAHHARVFAAASGAVLAGVFDVDRGRAAAIASANQSAVLRSEAEAIDCAELLVLATPTSLHFEQCKRALSARRHVLVEKPLSERATDARALCDLAREHGVKLIVGHSERFNPVVRAIARAVNDETVLRIATRRTATVGCDDDVCLNLAVHDIDLVAFLSRRAVELDVAWGTASESFVSLRAGSASATVSVGRTSTRVRTLDVTTDEAAYRGDLLAQRLLRNGVDVELEGREPLELQAEETLEVVWGVGSQASRLTVALGHDGARAVALATAAAQLRGGASPQGPADAHVSPAE
jgi:predicted dehydrogenase